MNTHRIEPIAKAIFTSCLEAQLTEQEAIQALCFAGIMLLSAHSETIEQLSTKAAGLPEVVRLYFSANVKAFEAALREKQKEVPNA